jgi:hypothetical protein
VAKGDQGSNSSQEQLTRSVVGENWIVKTIETKVHTGNVEMRDEIDSQDWSVT